MLRSLHAATCIEHLAVIERVEVEFEAGLNVLTGETGAGKSILVEAIGLLVGGRAIADLVRTGEDLATIQAIFEAPGEEVIVRRELTSQGRSRAFVDGTLATAGALRDLAARLIEVSRPARSPGPARPEGHLDLLDDFAGLATPRDRVAAAYRARGASRQLDTLQLDERQKLTRTDLLSFERDEIGRTAPQTARTRRCEQDGGSGQRGAAGRAERDIYQSLYDADDAALSTLATVWKRVADLATLDERAAPARRSTARPFSPNWRNLRTSCATTRQTLTPHPDV